MPVIADLSKGRMMPLSWSLLLPERSRPRSSTNDSVLMIAPEGQSWAKVSAPGDVLEFPITGCPCGPSMVIC